MKRPASRGEGGQAAPEWLGLVLLVALAIAALAALGARVPGLDLAAVIAKRLVCAAGIGSGCGGESELVTAYGPELAALVARHAPRLLYEEGMSAVPVDFRTCREDACAEGPEAGPVRVSRTGEPATAFVHVVDCREPEASPGVDCGGEAAGNVYVQYWLYYPGSATARAILGARGAHPDDFESFQVRVRPGGGTDARASSHHGYNGATGDWLSDAGIVRKPAWTRSTGSYAISGGSHAGRVSWVPARAARAAAAGATARWTEPAALRLVPVESLGAARERFEFAVTPPWEKRVYLDPEYGGTD